MYFKSPSSKTILTFYIAPPFLLGLLLGLTLTVQSGITPGQMLPFHKVEESSGCVLHIEEYCFAHICTGYIKLGLNSNLDFSAIASDGTGAEKTMIIDENKVLLHGTYKNSVLQILKIPFFKQGDQG